MTTVSTGLRRVIVVTLILVAATAIVLVLRPQPALAATGEVVAVVAQESPYQPPDIQDAPGWLAPFTPIAGLPLWAQAAVLSAGAAGVFFVVPTVVRKVWQLVSDLRSAG